MQKGSEYILSLISSQTLSLYPAINDMVDLCPNLWCNNYKTIFFLDDNLFALFPPKLYYLCALYGKLTVFFSSDPNYTVQNPLRNKQVCTKLINVIMENNQKCVVQCCNKSISVIATHVYLYFYFLFRCDVMFVHRFNMFIR